ncbi:phosphoadenosine phosphosulfate reductase family protein [candidate division WOR-3 bacterium]|nr:phosphoadenosine phosphosulfate reductase family protein [candidate division WOR-3 bacterium]
MSLADKAIERIRDFYRKHGSLYLMFSGGKDSTAILLLTLQAVPRSAIRGVVFTEVTGNTHPCNIEYVKSTVEKLGLVDKLIYLKREDLDFFQALVKWGLPHIKNRWCLNEFKFKVWRNANIDVSLIGVKYSDSHWRRRYDWSKPKRLKGTLVFSPIYDWETENVVDYLRTVGVPLSPCYEKYGHSGNCMFCPFRTKAQIEKTMRDPEWGPKIAYAVSKLRNEWGRREAKRWLRYYTAN